MSKIGITYWQFIQSFANWLCKALGQIDNDSQNLGTAN